jgi:hypothetical protein
MLQIPISISNLLDIEEILLNNNNFGGEIDTQFLGLNYLKTLDIGNNKIIGDMDPGLCDGREGDQVIENLTVDCLTDDAICSCATRCCDTNGYCCDMTGDQACGTR